MIYCPLCNTANRNGSKFCNECGASLSDLGLLCPACAATNLPTNRFCSACGHALTEAALLPPAETPSVAVPDLAAPEFDDELPSLEADVPLTLMPSPAVSMTTSEGLASADVTPAGSPAGGFAGEWLVAQDGIDAQPPEALVTSALQETAPVAVDLPAWLNLPEPAPSPPELPAWLSLAEPAWLPDRALPGWLDLTDSLSGQAVVAQAETGVVLPAWLFLPEAAQPAGRILPECIEEAEEPATGSRSLPDWLDVVEPMPAERRSQHTLPPWLLEEERPAPPPPMPDLPPWLFVPELEGAARATAPAAAEPPIAVATPAIVPVRPFRFPQPPRRPAAEDAGVPSYEEVFSDILRPKTDTTPAISPLTPGRSRLISALLVLVICVPLLVPMGINVDPQRATLSVFDTVEALPSTANVLLSFDWTPGTDEEMAPIAEVILRHLVRRKVKIVAVSLTPEGGKLAQRILDRTVFETRGYEYGRHVLNLGYLPGGVAAIRAMMGDLAGSYGVDHFGNAAKDSLLLREMSSFKKADLVVVLTSESETLVDWVSQVSATYQGIRMVAGVSAAALPFAQPFAGGAGSGQIKGTLMGIRGAAEYELALNEPRLAIAATDAQSLVSVFLALVIVVGNLAHLRAKLKKPQLASNTPAIPARS